MVPVNYLNVDQSTMNPYLPDQNNVNVLPAVSVPKEIGDYHRRIVGLFRKKAQDYATQQGGFYVFVYNMISQNQFQNQLFYRYIQIAIDGAAYTPFAGGMLVESTMTEAVDAAFTGLVGKLIEDYGNQPEVRDMAHALRTPKFNKAIEAYNNYIESNVNQFIRLRSQRNQGQPMQQPMQQGWNQPQMPMQQQGGWNQQQVQQQAIQQGIPPYYPPNQPIQQQPQYPGYQQPQQNIGWGQPVQQQQVQYQNYQQPMQQQQQMGGMNTQVNGMAASFQPGQPQQPLAQQSVQQQWQPMRSADMSVTITDAYEDLPTQAYVKNVLADHNKPSPSVDWSLPEDPIDDAWDNIQEFGTDGIVYGDERGFQPSLTTKQEAQTMQAQTVAPLQQAVTTPAQYKEVPAPKRVGDVKLEPGVHGKVFDERRPYDHFISNGGVHVYSELYAYNHKIVDGLTELRDFANEVAFVVKWPDGRLENMIVPISEGMDYMSNETLELALPYAHAQRGIVADMLKDLHAGKKPIRKEYRDITDEEVTNHEPLSETIELEGSTNAERDQTARTAVRERDGAIAGVVTYHSYERTPLSTLNADAKTYLSEMISGATDLTDLAFGVTNLFDTGDITEETVRIIDRKMTDALNGYFQTEKGTTLWLDSFLDDIAGMMGWMEEEHASIYAELMKEQAELIRRVLTVHVDYAMDDDSEDDAEAVEEPIYIEDHQLNVLIPIHSLNFAMLLKQKRFAMALNRRLHAKLEGYLSYHIVDQNDYTRIRVVTCDGVELFAVKGQNGVTCLTTDSKHI